MSADDDGGAAFWQAVSARETDWWATHAASVGALEELQKLGMQPENCWFAGELLFLRRGLKPCGTRLTRGCDSSPLQAFLPELPH